MTSKPTTAAKAPAVALFFLQYDAPYEKGGVYAFPRRSAEKLIRYGVARLATPEEKAAAERMGGI